MKIELGFLLKEIEEEDWSQKKIENWSANPKNNYKIDVVCDSKI